MIGLENRGGLSQHPSPPHGPSVGTKQLGMGRDKIKCYVSYMTSNSNFLVQIGHFIAYTNFCCRPAFFEFDHEIFKMYQINGTTKLKLRE